jgi:hypothetical protein
MNTYKQGELLMNNLSKKMVVALSTVVLLTTACSKKSTSAAADAGSGVSVASVVGKISDSTTIGSSKMNRKMQSLSVHPSTTVSGCTASAYDLTGTTVLGSATSDSTGKFVISGLADGSNYKIVVTCGSTSYSSVISADTADTATKATAEVSPGTTLLATQIIDAVVKAVTAVTNGMDATIAKAITATLLSPANMATLISTVKTAVENAVAAGTLVMPDAATASSMSGSLATSTDSTAATTAYTSVSGNTIPVSLTNSVTSAGSAAAAFPSCDNSLPSTAASITLCTQAVAKMMYNVLGWTVGIYHGAAFGNYTCSSSDTTLTAAFPNATFYNGDGSGGSPISGYTNFCFIKNNNPTLDRNKGYGDLYGGGDDGGGKGPMFMETGGVITDGFLTALGTTLYNKTNFHLSDVDSLLGGGSIANGGFQLRALGVKVAYPVATAWPKPNNNNGGGNGNTTDSFYLLNGTVGSLTPTDWSASSCPASPRGNSGSLFQFSTPGDWTSITAGSLSTCTTAIHNSSNLAGLSLANFGGTIPSETTMFDQMKSSSMHAEFNKSGQPNFWVVYDTPPDYMNSFCQNSGQLPTTGTITVYKWDNTVAYTATECTDQSGQPVTPSTVNVTMSAADTTTGESQIASVTKVTGGTGKYFIYPVFGNGGWSGLFSFIEKANGRVLKTQAMKNVTVQVMLDSSQCLTANNFPAAGGSCAKGDFFNVGVTWSCSGSGPCTMTTKALSPVNTATAAVKITNSGVATTLSFNANNSCSTVNSINMCGIVLASNPNGGGGGGGGGGGAPPAYAMKVSLTGNAITSAGTASPYYMVQKWDCTGAVCGSSGYYLVDKTTGGLITTGTTGSGTLPTGVTAGTFTPQGGGGPVSNVLVYSDTYLNSLGATVFPYCSLSSGSCSSLSTSSKDYWYKVAGNFNIPNGPTANPNYDCTLDPYFDDADGSGVIHYTTTNGKNTCTTKTFNGNWEISQAVWKCANNNLDLYSCGGTPSYVATTNGAGNAWNIKPNPSNQFEFGDLSARTGLMHLAFGPWLDGKHTLDATTNLNSLQVFGLVYMLLSGGGDYSKIHGLETTIPGTSETIRNFQLMAPICMEDSGGADTCNGVLAKGITNFHQ